MMAIQPLDLSFDVSAAIGIGEELTQKGWLFVPYSGTDIRGAMVCLAGGSYDKHYWHLEVPGYAGYSFAECLAAHGYVVVAVDHLGVGGSSDPATAVSDLQLLATGDAAVATQIRERLGEGTLGPLPALPDLPLIGVGHSMGACLTTMVQAEAPSYDAVVLLGYGVEIANVYEGRPDVDELEVMIDQVEAQVRATTAVQPGGRSTIVDRSALRPLFHNVDVPDAVIAADDAAASRVPIRCVAEVTTPGFVRDYAAAIDVPVFLGFGGAVDVAPDPHREVANYPSCPDISLFVLPRSGHCHNFAETRDELWDRIAGWTTLVTTTAVRSSP
jgi:alpha-beta hydrolase superfamily lysophospholipase